MALGTEVPVVFCNDEEVAAKLHTLSGGVWDQASPPRWSFSQLSPPPKIISAQQDNGSIESIVRTLGGLFISPPRADLFYGLNH